MTTRRTPSSTRRLRPLGATLAAAAALSALAACSADNGTSPSTSVRSGTPTTSTEPTAGGPVGGLQPGGGGGGGQRPRMSPYVQFDSCDALVSWAREQMSERVTAYGLGGGYGWGGGGIVDAMPATTAAAADTTAAGAEAAPREVATDGSGSSGTNTHTEGVDEGDIVETDGRYVYSIADGVLRSVDLDTSQVVASVGAPAWATDMILNGNRLLLAGTDWSGAVGATAVATYAVEGGTLTPLGRTYLEGTLVSVRSIDGRARLVIQQPFGAKLPFVQPRDGSSSASDDALDRNREVVEQATAADLLPRRFTEGPNGGSGPIEQAIDCTQVGYPTEFSGLSTVWVATVDLTGADSPVVGSAGVIADAQTVYSSKDRLYIAAAVYDDGGSDVIPVLPAAPVTGVHSFDLAAADGADYAASGEVDGTVLNQYALSEYDGSLRVATTTTAGGFGDSLESGVHVLQQQGDALVEVGAIGGLGRGETIQGVRFVDDRGYVVTFRQVDPLYVLDLSDPTAPRLDGELKVPGYSAYLHPVGDGRLLTVGVKADPSGRAEGTQLALFDVSDPTAPAQLATLDLDSWSTEAIYDPHAFLYWPATGTVVVPTDACWNRPWVDENGDGQMDDPEGGCDAAVVGTLSGDQLVEAGRLTGSQPIRRSLVANGRLVTLDGAAVHVYDLTTLTETATIPF